MCQRATRQGHSLHSLPHVRAPSVLFSEQAFLGFVTKVTISAKLGLRIPVSHIRLLVWLLHVDGGSCGQLRGKKDLWKASLSPWELKINHGCCHPARCWFSVHRDRLGSISLK